MKRRNFIKLSATATAIGLLPLELKAMLKQLSINECDFSNRKIILVNLAGANDGLNTIVPLNQYDTYSNLRPNIRIPETGLHKYITLDSTLANNQQIGLNPSMTGFKSLYDQGWLRIIQAVGYPSQNKSHFASTDVYLTGNDGNSWLNGSDSGWIGRYMELYYQNELNATYPLAVQIGSKNTSLGFHGINEHGMALNITGQDVSGFYSVLSGLAGEPPQNIPNSHYGTELDYIIQTDNLSNQYSQAISNAFDNGTNGSNYPDTDLGDQLKTVAKLISGGLSSKVYMVSISGFDTHNNQIEIARNPNGKHSNLLNELSSAIEIFFNDLDNQGLANDIVGVTYSEFGRKAAENGNLGTDHGEISPMFVFGKPIQGGVSGTNPDLTEATSSNNFQIDTVQHDYRETFTTLLQNFLGASDAIVDSAFFNNSETISFTESKINDLIKTSFEVPITCYGEVLNIDGIKKNKVELFPNPFTTSINLKGSYELKYFNKYEVYNLSGQLIKKGELVYNLSNSISINLESLSNDVYLLKIISKGIIDNYQSDVFKILKN
tara:strand:+ start:5710 stop:7356 length:1647 start_codon:yes stop_codon:yes gene_type:complete